MKAAEVPGLSYREAGVDIDVANATKRSMADLLRSGDARVLNSLGAFASLFEASFPGYEHPVLVLKTEEPGTKQRLAVENKRYSSICYDMINHLINDIIVMGATPVAVQDAIICGKLEQEVVSEMVGAIAAACREQGCSLTGGETSEQPGVILAGTYILTSSVVGVVEKAGIIDGSRIREGDRLLALASNGLHTNGYSLVRRLLESDPGLADTKVDGESFLEVVLRRHRCYFHGLRGIFGNEDLHGMAHITGGGIAENVDRILPAGVAAEVDLSTIRPPAIFRAIRDAGRLTDADMLRTFNMGVGLMVVAARSGVDEIREHLATAGYESLECGEIVAGDKNVVFKGSIAWA